MSELSPEDERHVRTYLAGVQDALRAASASASRASDVFNATEAGPAFSSLAIAIQQFLTDAPEVRALNTIGFRSIR